MNFYRKRWNCKDLIDGYVVTLPEQRTAICNLWRF